MGTWAVPPAERIADHVSGRTPQEFVEPWPRPRFWSGPFHLTLTCCLFGARISVRRVGRASISDTQQRVLPLR
jgi:hypothetical protein